MKKCPYCAEEIQDEAIKCKHCQSLINAGQKANGNAIAVEKHESFALTKPQKLTEEESSEYNGLAGWLFLVALGLILSLIGSISEVFSLEDNTGKIISGIFTIFIAYTAYLFFTKKRLFKRFFIILLIINFLGGMVLLVDNSDESIKEFLRSLVSLIIWVPYTLKSKRVRATFIK